MRKKSHLSLTGYLLKSMNMDELKTYKKSFYIGSILPDCMPSFISRRHTMEQTFDILRMEIIKITDDYEIEKGITKYFTRHLGIVTHYLADYFTYPHNHIFQGSISEHCFYENDLKHKLRQYVKSEEAIRNREIVNKYTTVEALLNYIKEVHQEYLVAIKTVEMDCNYIVELCHKVVDAILHIFQVKYESKMLNQIEVA